jgi:hypothetical protein
MTVYYHYNEDGKLQSTSTFDPLTHLHPESPGLRYYVQQGDTVGAYLAQRNMLFSIYASSGAYGHTYHGDQGAYERTSDTYHGIQDTELRHHNEELYDSYESYPADRLIHASMAGFVAFAPHTKPHRAYPNPEDIRHLHTLHSLLPCIDPGRRFNSLGGPGVDIVEQGTGTVFAYDVPKKMLILFLGRSRVTKFIQTVRLVQDYRFKDPQKIQKVSIPQGVASRAAIRILVSWMTRACRPEYNGLVRQFDVPQNTFAACTLAQTLTLFGLYKDALRVDYTIARDHFIRPIFAVELAALWNCLGENSRYVYAALKVVGQRLRAYEVAASTKFPKHAEILQLLEEHPALKARVRDLDKNETYRPAFSTEWCRLVEDSLQSEMHFLGNQANGMKGFLESGVSGSTIGAEQRFLDHTEGHTTGTRKVTVVRIVPAIQKPLEGHDSHNPDEHA